MSRRLSTRNRKKKSKPTTSLLDFRDVVKDHGEVRAVGPVSASIGAGELVALVGHNGSGKSTLLSTAVGLLEPTEGEVLVNGKPAGEQPARAVVSYIPDHPVLYDDLSVQEHLDYLSRLHGTTPEDHDADGLLELLGLADRRDDLPSTFSRGLRQKTAIAIAFCRPFSLLLVDEPFSGLDEAGKEAFTTLLGRVKEQKGTAVVATHDAHALPIFDRAILLDQGALIYDGVPGDLPRRPTPTGERTQD